MLSQGMSREKPPTHLMDAFRTLITQDLGVASKDLATIELRSEHEGLCFLTKTLANLGKALDRGLGSGVFHLPTSFKRRCKGSQIPAFLGALFMKVFHVNGELRSDACPLAVKKLRQICFFCYKLEVDFRECEIADAVSGFIDTDNEVQTECTLPVDARLVRARALITQLFSNFRKEQITGQHTTGVSANTHQHGKFSYIPPESTVIRHFGRLFFNHAREYNYIHTAYFWWLFATVFIEVEIDWYEYRPTAKLMLVPKDSRGPRVISCEPTEHMYAQKGLQEWTTKLVENHPFTKGIVNFTDQTINRDIIIPASQSLEFSTLDLKDASDRVSLAIVEYLFGDCPDFLTSLLACRSGSTLIKLTGAPFHLHLRKFAPMGSAMCFPILAITIWSLLAADMQKEGCSMDDVRATIRVYGDDIITETWYAYRAMDVLERYGLRVNREKSFVKSHFLESCGMDAFKGVQVTPLRMKRVLPDSALKMHIKKRSRYMATAPDYAARIVSTTKMAQRAQQDGLTALAESLYRMVEHHLGTKLPYGIETTPFLCRLAASQEDAWDKNHNMGFAAKTSDGRAGYVTAYTWKSPKTTFKESDYGRLRRSLSLVGNVEDFIPVSERDMFVDPKSIVIRQRVFRAWYDTAYVSVVDN